MTTNADLVAASVWILKDVGTDAGQRIYSPGDWPTWDQEYPYVRIRCARERKSSLGNAAIEFDVAAAIRFTARVAYEAAPNDGGAAEAEAELFVLKQQIEQAIINHPQLIGLSSQFLSSPLEQYPFVESEIGFSSEGELHYAELQLDIGMKFYQGPEDFYLPRAYPLTDIRITSALPDPAAPGGELTGPVLDIQPST